jgi:hypothetical protein
MTMLKRLQFQTTPRWLSQAFIYFVLLVGGIAMVTPFI